MFSPRYHNQHVIGAFLDELEKVSMLRPARLSVRGGKGFSNTVARTTKPLRIKNVAPNIVTGKMRRSMNKRERMAPFGSKSTWGIQNPKLLGWIAPVKKRRKK
tara:strand:- start:4616 stop:4924 length:309 start_codon:yes stop_codon:yes gene_type:complete